MVQLVLYHVAGARSTQVDIVPLGEHRELILGRAASAAIRFDPRLDVQVARYHARITWNVHDGTGFLLTDLGSRAGTFVNGRRVEGAVVLGKKDAIQLGEGGPMVEISWETVPRQILEAFGDGERLDEELGGHLTS
jgi:pSer/pThr/pTyr-binding forkhead associated (FHA) protein